MPANTKIMIKDSTGAIVPQSFDTVNDTWVAASTVGSIQFPKRMRDNTGRLKVVEHQNIYDADFEYGSQPLRWESFVVGGATITSQPGAGGVRLRLSTAAGDVAIRQSRPYHRYQPGKTMYMATGTNLGAASIGQRQRVGFFDDGNGLFIEQADPTPLNPYGMFVTYRTDVNGVPRDTRIDISQWSDPDGIKYLMNWSNMQMIWMEYAWYGAGAVRWGVIKNGESFILHEIGFGDNPVLAQQFPWARTGNLPVRYEQRNLTAQAATNDFYHYGVSVCVEGKIDEQRGFTYAPGMAPATPRRLVPLSTTRFPLLSFRYRVMGTQEYTQASAAATAGSTTSLTVAGTPWTAGQWVGRYVFFQGLGSSGQGVIARITANTTNTLTFADNITGLAVATAPAAGQNYTIGIINRGQLLPRTLLLSCDQAVTLELISSTTSSPVVLTGATFASLASLGSSQSFTERDVLATALTGGEVVYNAPAPAGALQAYDLSNFFPLYNNIRGNQPDILTVAISTAGVAANVGCSVVIQEAMS